MVAKSPIASDPRGFRLRDGSIRRSGKWDTSQVNAPPDGLPAYRVLTGPDDEKFCRRVSEAIALGYQLYEGPAVTFNGQDVILAQALIWPAQ